LDRPPAARANKISQRGATNCFGCAAPLPPLRLATKLTDIEISRIFSAVDALFYASPIENAINQREICLNNREKYISHINTVGLIVELAGVGHNRRVRTLSAGQCRLVRTAKADFSFSQSPFSVEY